MWPLLAPDTLVGILWRYFSVHKVTIKKTLVPKMNPVSYLNLAGL